MTEEREAIHAQILTAYGIMTAMIIITGLCAFYSNGWDYRRFLAIFANAYAPTTVSFLATGLFDFDFIRNKKVINSGYVTLTVCTALFYAAFSSMESIGKGPATSFALVSTVCSFISVLAVLLHVKKSVQRVAVRKRKTSDGSIVGKGNRVEIW